MKQSAVEWLKMQLEIRSGIREIIIDSKTFEELCNEAKEIEKKQIKTIIKDIITESYSQGRIDAISDNPYAKDGENYYEIEFLNFPTNNIIDEWLDKNSCPEIANQVEEESLELFKQNTIEENKKLKEMLKTTSNGLRMLNTEGSNILAEEIEKLIK